MFFTKKSVAMPLREEALPGRAEPIPTAEHHFVNGNPLKGPYPEGLEMATLRARLLLGRRARLLEDRRASR